jgi:hypothetical protein
VKIIETDSDRPQLANARVAEIVASGFVTSSITVLAAPEKPNMSLLLDMLRAAQAAGLNDALAKPAGGIATALIVGNAA